MDLNTDKIKIQYSHRMSFALEVHPDTTVLVRAPIRASKQSIVMALDKNKAWIEGHIKRLKKQKIHFIPREFKSGFKHLYLGQAYRLKTVESRGEDMHLSDKNKTITLFGKEPEPDPQLIEKKLTNWYRTRADILFKKRIELFYQVMKLHKLPKPTYRIKKLRSRWGSCSARGNINLNLELIKFPIELIDYVICHEMCHLIQANHSRNFYALLATYIKDYKRREFEIKQFAQILDYDKKIV